MTKDRDLKLLAQAAINFIVKAQDPKGGGWRYAPRQPGDTSVSSWQILALMSGHAAELDVPKKTLESAMKFLDSVQSSEGAKYGYTTPGAGRATTAAGLLCRIHLGWKKDNAQFAKGVEFLSAQKPGANLYFSYYTTQLLRQYQGDPWEKWNDAMRERLVKTQDDEKHQKGSWHAAGDHGAERGGRLYNTAMSTLILESYYRHGSLYSNE